MHVPSATASVGGLPNRSACLCCIWEAQEISVLCVATCQASRCVAHALSVMEGAGMCVYIL
jgi:hypothetical protein